MPILKIGTDCALQYDPKRRVYWRLGFQGKTPDEHKLEDTSEVVLSTGDVTNCRIFILREPTSGMHWFVHAMPAGWHLGGGYSEEGLKAWGYKQLSPELNGGQIGLPPDARVEVVGITGNDNQDDLSREIKDWGGANNPASINIIKTDAGPYGKYTVEYTIPDDLTQEGQLRVRNEDEYVQYKEIYRKPFTSDVPEPEAKALKEREKIRIELTGKLEGKLNDGNVIINEDKKTFTELMALLSNTEEKQKLEKILEDIDAILKQAPTTGEAYFHAAHLQNIDRFTVLANCILGRCKEEDLLAFKKKYPYFTSSFRTVAFAKQCEDNGKYDKAIEYLQNCAKEKFLGKEKTLELTISLARVYEKMGDMPQAEKHYTKALEILQEPVKVEKSRYRLSPEALAAKARAAMQAEKMNKEQEELIKQGIERCKDKPKIESVAEPLSPVKQSALGLFGQTAKKGVAPAPEVDKTKRPDDSFH